jgi:hypothetical protein
MANERFYGPGEPFWGWRCVLCGEVFDSLIWENRNHLRKMEIAGGRGMERGKRR